MSSVVLLVLSALQLSSTFQNHTYTNNDKYYELPRFWTNVGFCPAGQINHKSITETLRSSAVNLNLRQIGALPKRSVTHIRVHWLLELVNFVAYTQAGEPMYDFKELDDFIDNLQDYGLTPTLEFMGNPGNVFTQNPARNSYLWEDLMYKIAHRYIALYGKEQLKSWRFETWNEPDLTHYNLLNFTFTEYLQYVLALRRGLTKAALRFSNNLQLPLQGPAGLFKNVTKHPLCWQMLEYCNDKLEQCPFQTLTYHRKGKGFANELLSNSLALLKLIHEKYPNLSKMPIANDEADPIAIWSNPHEHHAGIVYAWQLLNIVLGHWQAKLHSAELRNLAFISHDNAFLSYHPYEFTQRTLLAHFRMNNSRPEHSQFIQKPVYMALALLSRLANLAADIEILHPADDESFKVQLLKTTAGDDVPLQLSYLLLPVENKHTDIENFTFSRKLPFELCQNEEFAFGLDILAAEKTDPYFVWQQYGSPPYPNRTVLEQMRRAVVPSLQQYGRLTAAKLEFTVQNISGPFIIMVRACSNLVAYPKPPKDLRITEVTHGEVFLNWSEDEENVICLQTYEVWFQQNSTDNWKYISDTWHIPFPNFQYAPLDQIVNGFYKVRSRNLFDEPGVFSEVVEYFQY